MSLLKRFLAGILPLPKQFDPEAVAALIKDIRAAKLTYCGPPKLENLAEACTRVIRNSVPGIFLEAGVALGGSAILLGRLKPPHADLCLYDVFETIPAPGEKDGEDAHRRYREIIEGKSAGLGDNLYYGYMPNLMDVVIKNLGHFGLSTEKDRIQLIKGRFEKTLAPGAPIALAHIDCDWHDSVRACINNIAPRLSVGGIMIFDDYSSFTGCKKAVDEWLAADNRFSILFHRRSLAVMRLG